VSQDKFAGGEGPSKHPQMLHIWSEPQESSIYFLEALRTLPENTCPKEWQPRVMKCFGRRIRVLFLHYVHTCRGGICSGLNFLSDIQHFTQGHVIRSCFLIHWGIVLNTPLITARCLCTVLLWYVSWRTGLIKHHWSSTITNECTWSKIPE
jgi:hypothetical protein